MATYTFPILICVSQHLLQGSHRQRLLQHKVTNAQVRRNILQREQEAETECYKVIVFNSYITDAYEIQIRFNGTKDYYTSLFQNNSQDDQKSLKDSSPHFCQYNVQYNCSVPGEIIHINLNSVQDFFLLTAHISNVILNKL